jgi:hypothetical protein
VIDRSACDAIRSDRVAEAADEIATAAEVVDLLVGFAMAAAASRMRP